MFAKSIWGIQIRSVALFSKHTSRLFEANHILCDARSSHAFIKIIWIEDGKQEVHTRLFRFFYNLNTISMWCFCSTQLLPFSLRFYPCILEFFLIKKIKLKNEEKKLIYTDAIRTITKWIKLNGNLMAIKWISLEFSAMCQWQNYILLKENLI